MRASPNISVGREATTVYGEEVSDCGSGSRYVSRERLEATLDSE